MKLPKESEIITLAIFAVILNYFFYKHKDISIYMP